MAWAEVFCPRSRKDRFALWGALFAELREATFELSDPRLVEAKTTWWAEELLRSVRGSPTHPLTQALATPELPWPLLAHALVAMTHAEPSRPTDHDAALTAMTPLADKFAAMEAGLFGNESNETNARAIAVHLLAERLHAGDHGSVPLTLLARHGLAGAALAQGEGEKALADWAGELASAMPTDLSATPLFRRTRAAFDAWRLRERAVGRDRRAVPPLSALRLTWRSARAGATG